MAQLFKSIIVALFIVFVLLSANAQTSFKLYKCEGNYYTKATVNGRMTDSIFLETGSASVVMNKDVYKNMPHTDGFEAIVNEADTINPYWRRHKVLKAFKGRLWMGDMLYDGKILVVENINRLIIPIHRLKNTKDSLAHIISLDFKDSRMSWVSEGTNSKRNFYQITDVFPGIIIQTEIKLADRQGRTGVLNAPALFDLGSKTPLALFGSNTGVRHSLKESGIKIHPTTFKDGVTMGYGFYASYCKIGQKVLRGFSVSIQSSLPFYKAWASIGPSLLGNLEIAIDLKDKKIYY